MDGELEVDSKGDNSNNNHHNNINDNNNEDDNTTLKSAVLLVGPLWPAIPPPKKKIKWPTSGDEIIHQS